MATHSYVLALHHLHFYVLTDYKISKYGPRKNYEKKNKAPKLIKQFSSRQIPFSLDNEVRLRKTFIKLFIYSYISIQPDVYMTISLKNRHGRQYCTSLITPETKDQSKQLTETKESYLKNTKTVSSSGKGIVSVFMAYH